MYLCLCKGISDADVRQIGRLGKTDAEAIIDTLGLRDDECCGNCLSNMDEFVSAANQGAIPVEPALLYPVAS